MNQFGTFTATLTGTLVADSTKTATATFIVTVVGSSSCSQTTLTAAALKPMSYSVSQAASCTQQTGTINDAVDNSFSRTL